MPRIYYAGGVVLEGDPADLPKTGVLLVCDTRIIGSANYYIWNAQFRQFGQSHSEADVLDNHFRGNPVFKGEWVSEEEWIATQKRAHEDFQNSR